MWCTVSQAIYIHSVFAYADRPISLLPTTWKVFERLLHAQMLSSTAKNLVLVFAREPPPLRRGQLEIVHCSSVKSGSMSFFINFIPLCGNKGSPCKFRFVNHSAFTNRTLSAIQSATSPPPSPSISPRSRPVTTCPSVHEHCLCDAIYHYSSTRIV